MKHFADTTAVYTRINPQWKSSRRGVLEFVFRVHNSVNMRNNKKVYSFYESIQELSVFLPESQATARRREYLMYIRNDWMKNMTLDGISSVGKIKELNTIEDNYWSVRSFKWSDIREFSNINVLPLPDTTSALSSSLLGGTVIPKLTMPAKGFTLRNIGKIGPLSSLRS
jgi:hypothetical protein